MAKVMAILAERHVATGARQNPGPLRLDEVDRTGMHRQ